MNTVEIREFEGRTEREAVAKAAAELGSESFDVEVIEKSGGLFGRGKVKIRVKPISSIPDPMGTGNNNSENVKSENIPENNDLPEEPVDPPSDEILNRISSFIEGIIEKMGYEGKSEYKTNENTKLIFEIHSEYSNILIGKKGKNLDAIQLLANVYLNRIGGDDVPWRVVIDAEGYRARREESLIKLANRMADEAARTRSSRLLEPMNPFERRLIHTAINERNDVITKSEGDGLYKRVRIISKQSSRNRSRRRR
jgi:spoIIIJ-associated protein